MSLTPDALESLPLEDLERVDAICEEFVSQWQQGTAPRLEDFVAAAPERLQLVLAGELIRTEIELRREAGEQPSEAEYVSRFPQRSVELRSLLRESSEIVPNDSLESTLQLSARDTDGSREYQIPLTHSERQSGSNAKSTHLDGRFEHGRLGNYETQEILGRGGMGIVVLARDTKLDREVAIKLLSAEFAGHDAAKVRFLREARAAAAVRHDNVVTIYSVEEADGVPFLVMELIRGESLSTHLRLAGPLPAIEIACLSMQIALGLEAAHKRGLIHRDIKPANILLERTEGHPGASFRAKITDFGLARATAEAGLTHTGAIAGTPPYMSPEQALGEPLDHRTDLFSLGSLMYALCTGRAAFHAESAVVVLRKVSDSIPQPIRDINPAIPRRLSEIVEKLMAKRREDRFQSAAEVAEVLRKHLVAIPDGGSMLDERAPQPIPASANRFRRALLPALVGVAVLIAVAVWLIRPPVVKVARTTADRPIVAPQVVPVVAPFMAEQAQSHQADCARRLGVPVEFTNSLGMRFVLIPPGEYTRGSPPEVTDAVSEFFPKDLHFQASLRSQSPPHRVLLTKPFYIGVHEVTQQNYTAIMDRNPASFSTRGVRSAAVENQDTSQLPVETVSWFDAVQFCQRLSDREQRHPGYSNAEGDLAAAGQGYRLPSEAEWEFACRAGTESRYWTGDLDSDLHQAAWVSTHLDSEAGGEFPPHVVGQLQANPFGLFDTHGNVWEWCHDWFGTVTYANFVKSPATDPTGPTASLNGERILRGGFYHGPAYKSGSANRDGCRPETGFHHIGFRIVLPVERSSEK
jgi:formylglycine-generating enzyme required for sulfatase activity